MTSRLSQPPGEAGFSLVETLVAMAIVATTMAMTFGSIAINARTTQTMIDRRAAVLVARSVLDLAASSDGTADLPLNGTDGRLSWRIAVEPYQSRAETAPPLDLITVTVATVGSDRPMLQLRTLKVGR